MADTKGALHKDLVAIHQMLAKREGMYPLMDCERVVLVKHLARYLTDIERRRARRKERGYT